MFLIARIRGIRQRLASQRHARHAKHACRFRFYRLPPFTPLPDCTALPVLVYDPEHYPLEPVDPLDRLIYDPGPETEVLAHQAMTAARRATLQRAQISEFQKWLRAQPDYNPNAFYLYQ